MANKCKGCGAELKKGETGFCSKCKAQNEKMHKSEKGSKTCEFC